jgi:hypothetical protein
MYVRYNNGARRSQHILICVYHILPRLLAQWSLQLISLPARRIPCHFNHSAYCPPVIPCDVTLHYTAYTTEYTKRWLSIRSPINMLACICTPVLNEHKYSRCHTTIGTFIIRMGQFTEMLRNRSIRYAVCIFRYLPRKWCRWEMNKDQWEMLTGKEMVMRILREYRPTQESLTQKSCA